MARPTKERRVEYIPEYNYFKPVGIPGKELEEICLSIEEIEAMRLKDMENLTQEEAAERMEVSRPTFQRILTEARSKLVRALIDGKAIRFQGGNYRLSSSFHCRGCGRITGRGRNRMRRGRESNYYTDCADE
ncbi:MAG: DUF134 domain-containing protein [Halanaerobiaceae bacterium]|nr:DUF134 domain-containing protein [Halanaerobiaceae bacterium]